MGGLAMWRSFKGGEVEGKGWKSDTAICGAPVFPGLRTEVEFGNKPMGRR